ncbi:MAG: Cys-Gln thioester bond-forming surface protein [Clostridiales Family XIII bacterium]|jgi:hypothetical protein|nr:Cys-Gln thioester bond-forming surface protein [Clostridiales Family XIII bacterium]
MRKLKKSVSLLLTAVLISALLPAGTVFADPGPDANDYDVVLRYLDTIQIDYIHKNGDTLKPGDTVADIPIGGAWIGGERLISQIYCVDAVVPFHSRVTGVSGIVGSTTYPLGQTTDTVEGYVAVSPDNLKGVLKAHWNELLWLVINGYSGNYGAGATNESVIALNNRYPNLSDNIGPLGRIGGHLIPEDVAIMATKVAVWHFTNPDVAYLSTSFLKNSKGKSGSPDGIKHRQFVALLKRLTDDAAAYAANPTPALGATQMQLAVEPGSPNVGDAPVYTDMYRSYYGPYKITDSSNILGASDLVFLEATGYDPVARYAGFYTMNGSSFPALQSIQKYGEDNSYWGSAIEKDKEFYIGVLPNGSLDGVSITALARATAKVKNMPVVLVHQDAATGEQDWEDIQAFIGLSHDVPATVYGQAALPLSSSSGQIRVSKTAAENRTFLFKLTDSVDAPVRLGLLSNMGILPSDIVNGDAGIFKLNTGSTVTLGSLNLGDYKVTEIDSKGFAPSYTTGSSIGGTPVGTPGFGLARTVPVSLYNDGELASVDFTNTSTPYELTVVKRSDDSNGSPLNGATFSLTGPAGSNYYEEETTATVGSESGILTFRDFPVPISETVPDIYTLSEISPPPDHLALNDVIFIEVSAAGVSIRAKEPADENHVIPHSGGGPGGGAVGITVVNEYHNPPNPYVPTDPPPDYIVFVSKRSTSANNPLPALPGVTFTLEKGGESYSETTDPDGTLFFDVSVLFNHGDPNDLNGTYTLTETAWPANHTKLKGSVTFELNNGVGYTDISVTDSRDRASVSWLDPANPPHDYLAFRIIDAYSPPGGSGNSPPPKPEPEEPEKPVEPEEPVPPVPETPDNTAPDNPDTHNPPDSPTPGGDRNIPQTGDDTNTAQWLLLLLLALCAAVAVWRLRGNGKRGAERQ